MKTPTHEQGPGALAVSLGPEVCLGPVQSIPAGEGRRFTAGAAEVAVFRTRDGALYAVDDRCPHRGAPLSDGLTGSGQVICPYHAYRFQLADGSCVQDPGCRLRTYPVREEGGLVVLTLGC